MSADLCDTIKHTTNNTQVLHMAWVSYCSFSITDSIYTLFDIQHLAGATFLNISVNKEQMSHDNLILEVCVSAFVCTFWRYMCFVCLVKNELPWKGSHILIKSSTRRNIRYIRNIILASLSPRHTCLPLSIFRLYSTLQNGPSTAGLTSVLNGKLKMRYTVTASGRFW